MTETLYTGLGVERYVGIAPVEAKVIAIAAMAVPFVVLCFRNCAAARASTVIFSAAVSIAEEAKARELTEHGIIQAVTTNLLAISTLAPLIACNAVSNEQEEKTTEEVARHGLRVEEFVAQQSWLLRHIADASLAIESLAWFACPLSPVAFSRTILAWCIMSIRHSGYVPTYDVKRIDAKMRKIDHMAAARPKCGDDFLAHA